MHLKTYINLLLLLLLFASCSNNKLLFKKELFQRLGTNFYNIALYTKGGILLHPGKLAISMIDVLPDNVNLFENSY